jgi:hypothetical protein
MSRNLLARWFAYSGARQRQQRRGRPAASSWYRPPLLERLEDRIAPAFALGAASNYAILFEGGGSNNTLSITNVTTNVTGSGPGQGGGIGNIGVGGAGKATVGGPSTVGGVIDFSASNTGQFSSNNPGNVIPMGRAPEPPTSTSPR